MRFLHVRLFLDLIVVYVSDTGSNRKLLQHMLKQINLQSDGAENGQIAVDMVESCPYDLVFMDHSMPVMVSLLFDIIDSYYLTIRI